MPYKISGTKTETGRVIVVDESDFSVEKTVLIEGSGDYEVEVTNGKKTILARSVSGETLGWGNVTPTEMLDMALSDVESFAASFNQAAVTQLTNTKAIVCYNDGGNYGTARILGINDATMTVGDPVVFENGRAQYLSVIKLTDTKAIVCYQDEGNNYRGTACVLDISGSTIIAGTPVVFKSRYVYTCIYSVEALSETKAIVCFYNQDDNTGESCILDVSGTSITVGPIEIFENATANYISVTTLTDTKAIVCYRDGGNSGRGTACILNISDSTITAETPVIFETTNTAYMVASKLNDTKIVVCYKRNNSYGATCVLSIDGDAITYGAKSTFDSDNVNAISVSCVADTKAVVCYLDYGNSSYGTYRVLDVSGTTVTVADPHIFNSTGTGFSAVAKIENRKAIICYTGGKTRLIYNIN